VNVYDNRGRIQFPPQQTSATKHPQQKLSGASIAVALIGFAIFMQCVAVIVIEIRKSR
jgi:hypothetical protein